jgi:hypothetical protein
MTVKRGIALACLVAAAAFPASAQTRDLNPTVKVLARPQSAVPAECATDPATVPALEADAPALEPVNAAVPPSNDLRASLRRLQVAAEGDDYAVFKSAFAEARRAVAAHPPGGERNAANDALQVFTDIGRIWDYAMTSPTGSFFDATVQGGSLLNALKRYPEYGRTIADQTVATGGRTLYPTPETRRFLTRESARRLGQLGVSTPPRVARGAQPEPAPRRVVATQPPIVKRPAQIVAKPVAPRTTAPKKTASNTTVPKTTIPPKKTASKTTAPKKTEPKPTVKTAKATPPKTKTVEIKATPLPKIKTKPTAPPPVKVAETSTMPPGPPIVSTPPPIAPTTTTTTPRPPAQTTSTSAPPAPTNSVTAPVTTTTAPPPAATSTTDTTISTTTSSSTDTSVTAAPDTAATATSLPAGKQNGNMNLILAVVLILVGIGVLVVLFRASD